MIPRCSLPDRRDGDIEFAFGSTWSDPHPLDVFTVTTLDRMKRTDTWYLTVVGVKNGTDPTDPDTDGDGYWDGWFGVYNVSYDHGRGLDHAENVILYREHLQSGDGIEGDEIVQKQIEVHNVTAAPSAAGADIDDDGVKEHSNVHVGELQWGTSPTGESAPAVGFSVEADFVEGIPEATFNTSNWAEGVEENYALYGIVVDIVRDDTVSGILQAAASANDENQDPHLLVSRSPPSTKTCRKVAGHNVCTPESVPEIVRNAWAFNMEASTGTWPWPVSEIPDNGILMYGTKIANDADGLVSSRDRRSSPYPTDEEVLGAFVTMHELGHSLGIGRADDGGASLPWGEVYSGNNDDNTPERITIQGSEEVLWSIMRRSWGSQTLIDFLRSSYYVFSIEELLTIHEVDS